MICRVLVLLSLWGAPAVSGNSAELFRVRLVGWQSGCRGQLQVQKAPDQVWTEVSTVFVPLWFGHRLCLELDCGEVLSVETTSVSRREALTLDPNRCEDASLSTCFLPDTRPSVIGLEVHCSDSVRLVGGRSLCSGSLQIRDQSLSQSWTPVCEGALDRRGAEVLCRELGCGAPLLQGALSPLGQTFLCEGHESALMDCPQTLTEPGTCSFLHLTCSELRLVGGASRCEGTLEVSVGADWRRAWPLFYPWPLEAAAVVCRGLDCGAAVATERRRGFNDSDLWVLTADCVNRTSAVRDCVLYGLSDSQDGLDVVCSGGSPTIQTLVLVSVVLIITAIV